MKLQWLLISLVLFLGNAAFAQDNDQDLGAPELVKEKKFDWSKLYVGGNVGFAFSQSTGFGSALWIDFSPDVSYQVHERVMLGTGVIYQYTQYFDPNQAFHVAGGRIFGRAFIFEGVFGQIEGTLLNQYLEFDGNGNYINDRVTRGNVLLGGGYRFQTGGNAFMNITILVPMIRNEFYTQYRPITTFGFGIGIR
jgi:opacity protein-like surface antigen